MKDMTIKQFQDHILKWYKIHRRSMPWRDTRDPYKILVSEIMLHQTRVSRVLPKYKEFLKAFPNIKTLAKANEKKLLNTWKGLGYWRRAKYLKETAKRVVKNHAGKFPKNIEELETLPGVGSYTARALACFAWNSKEPFIDTNIRRVYLHFFFQKKNGVPDAEILAIAKKGVWSKNPRQWHYALFDYGATELRDKTINKKSKTYTKQSPFKNSFRSFRTRALRYALKHRNKKIALEEMHGFLRGLLQNEETDFAPEEIMKSLEKDGLIKKQEMHYVI